MPDLERLPGEVLLEPKPQALFAEQALPIARLDGEAAYSDLDDLRITITRQPDGWHIDDELLDAMHDRGGPV
ncbi:MAG TPA: hypothetical protein VG099_22090 [Gemmataceae bacterium]|nr:hypothetical protein [Gemmataceae bacterium]